MMTQLEILQAKFQELIVIGKGLTSKRKQIFHLAPERILYLYKTYFEDLSSQYDYPEIASVINYDPADLEDLLLIMRFKLHLYLELDKDHHWITLPNYFPKAFLLLEEINRENHSFIPHIFKKGSLMFHHADPYGTNNWLNGIPLSQYLKPLEGTNLFPVTQINYDYFISADDNGEYFLKLSEEMRKDKYTLLSCSYHIGKWLDENRGVFEDIIRKNYCGDQSFFEQAVKIDTDGYWILGLADESVDIRENLVLDAIRNRHIFNLNYLKDERIKPFLDSHDFLLKVIEINHAYFIDFPDDLKNNKEILLAAIKKLPILSSLANDKLIMDPDIRKAAFSDKIRYISQESDAVLMKPIGIDFLRWPKDWQRDRELLLACAPDIWNWADDAFQLYKEIIQEFFSKDADFMKKVIEHFPDCLECAGEDIKDDKEIVRSAIMKDGDLLKYASHRLQADEELVRLAGEHIKDSNEEHLLDYDQ